MNRFTQQVHYSTVPQGHSPKNSWGFTKILGILKVHFKALQQELFRWGMVPREPPKYTHAVSVGTHWYFSGLSSGTTCRRASHILAFQMNMLPNVHIHVHT